MAIQKDGPNGPFVGKVGSIYGYVLNGQNIIRGARRRRTKKFTEGELLNQAKMKVANKFTRMLLPGLRYGYRGLAPKGSRVGAVQLAQSHIRKECVEIDAEGKPFVNPEKVYVFRGDLYPPRECSVRREGDVLHFKWHPDEGYGSDLYKVNILVYDVDNDLILKVAAAEVRVGEYSITSDLLKRNKGPLHVYMGIVDTFRGKLSNSVYLGVVE